MAFVFRKGYGSSTEQRREAFFQTLSEKDRRRYAAMEAMKLGHGEIAYMARVLGCSRRTMEHGIAELETLPQDPAEDRIRRPGGWPKESLGIAAGFGAPFVLPRRAPYRGGSDAGGFLLDRFVPRSNLRRVGHPGNSGVPFHRGGSLPDVLFPIQPSRASLLLTRHQGMPGRSL